MVKLKLLTITVLMIFLLSSCGTKESVSSSNAFTEFKNHKLNEKLLEGNKAFSFTLFHEVIKSHKEDNVLVSPISISAALTMTSNGAGGNTLEQMKNTLGFKSLDQSAVNSSFAALQYQLQKQENNQALHIANSIWIRKGLDVQEDFKNTNLSHFDAESTELNFDSPDASKTMNKWVSNKTNGKIEEIVPKQIDPDTVMFLLNAVYFKGAWKYPFNKDMTYDGDFHLADGSKVNVPFMTHDEKELEFLDGSEFNAVRLPYGEKEDLLMTVLVPDEGQSLEQLVSSFTKENWDRWNQEFYKTEGTVRLPKFQFEKDYKLNDILIGLGMKDAFQDGVADFSKIATPPPSLYIGNVKHKTFIDVNEKGTEAAAVTSVEIKAESARLDVMEVNANRPFLFTIHDQKTETLLFMGKVENPKE
ncbi:serpin family protein [Bacillus carboniphilus]|uniref:Serpin family protein n=1 Tax=Bacillus carboniphilus TaxID=86663 RepID=A0ABN0VSA9_9BACI